MLRQPERSVNDEGTYASLRAAPAFFVTSKTHFLQKRQFIKAVS